MYTVALVQKGFLNPLNAGSYFHCRHLFMAFYQITSLERWKRYYVLTIALLCGEIIILCNEVHRYTRWPHYYVFPNYIHKTGVAIDIMNNF